jgi:hypothetical protein
VAEIGRVEDLTFSSRHTPATAVFPSMWRRPSAFVGVSQAEYFVTAA